MSKKNLSPITESRVSTVSAVPAVLEALEPRLLLSLVAHLELNETSGSTAADSVGNHDGTLYDDTTWDDGRISNSAYFDGANDRIELANSNDFDFGASTSFTVSAWVRDESISNHTPVVCRGISNSAGWGGTTEGAGWGIVHKKETDQYVFGISDGTNGTCSDEYALDGPEGMFHMLTMVVDRSAGNMYCYVDAELIDTVNISSIGSIDSTGEAMQIGGTTTWWKGMIDDVRVYDHALTGSDVEDLYEDAPTWATLYAEDNIASEDAPETDAATFRVLRTGSLSGAITVNYSVSGTAGSADYSETLGGTVTIGDGESYADITVTPVIDGSDDGETLTLTLASGTGYDVDNIDEASATIYDDAQLLAHLTMDEGSGTTASDSTGYGFDGTLTGATWTDGWIGNGVYLDGAADYVTIANATDIDFGGDQSFSVSIWFDDPAATYKSVVSKGNSKAQYGNMEEGAGWGVGNGGTNRMNFGITDGVNAAYANITNDTAGIHLLTMVVDRDTQTLYGYIDGTLRCSTSISSVGSIASFSEPLMIGATTTLVGMVDDLRIYTYALDSTEIADLYETTMPLVSIAAIDSMAIEDTADTATFRVSRSSTSGNLTVNYSVSGTAISADYSETLGGTVTITDGNSYVDITITPVDDAADDGETVILTLASGVGYQPGESDSATATIYDSGELMMRLTLDETTGSTAADATGNGHTGTLYGSTTWNDGRIDNGAYFDGSGDYIEADDSDDFDFGSAQSFTISAWVRDDGSANNTPTVCRGISNSAGWGGTTQGAGWGIVHSKEQDQYIFGISDGTVGRCSTAYTCSGPEGMFHLLTMVVDRSAANMYCYIDSVLVDTVSISSVGSIDSTGEALQIGGTVTWWKGMIDDVRVYNYALSGTDVGALYDDAPTWIILYADDNIASENAVGPDNGTIKVLRTGSISGAVAVNYSVSGTAAAGDYSETLGGTVSLEVGQREADLVITPVDDGTADDAETLTVTLASGTGYDVSDLDTATVTIYDEAGLLTHLKLDETSGSTAADATGYGFTGTVTGSMDWTYARIGNGLDLDGSNDYVTLANPTGIDFGGEQDFTVSIWVDGIATGYKSVVSKGNISAHTGIVTLGAGWAMGNSGTNNCYFGVADGTSVVKFGIANYTDGLHLLTMTVDRGAQILRGYIDGELVGQADISSLGSLASFNEPLRISSSGAWWAGVADDLRIYSYALSIAEVAALYEAIPPLVSIEAVDDAASETGSTTGIFRITRDGSTAEALEVDYTVSGTAAGADYSEALSGTVTIAAGENYADITITPVDDASSEGDETVIVTLTPSIADYAIASTAAGTATVTIGDSDNVSDPQVVITATDSEAYEADSDTATFRIYRSGATTSDLAVNYSVSGTADSGDYSETLSGTVTITSGNSYADITITPIDDSNFEYPETLTLTISEDVGYNIGLSDSATANLHNVPFNEQLNPTGDPIGGGEDYSDIIDIGDADYVVDTAGELVAALSSATYGDIIYVEDDAEIDLTAYVADSGYNALFIPSGVTLASGRGRNGSQGALIYTTDNWTNSYRVAMLGTDGDDIRITGLRLRGPSGFYRDNTDNDYAIGIRISKTGTGGAHKNVEVDNCEIYNWTMAGVYAMSGEDVSIHHNSIHTNIGNGYAYGIWFGGLAYSPVPAWVAEAEANYFDCNRHDIGSSNHWKWSASYNIFGPIQTEQVIDRHTGTAVDTWVENNWVQAPGDEFDVRFTSTASPAATVYYNDNWTTKEQVGPGPYYNSALIAANPETFSVSASGNTFSFDEYDDPYTPVAATTVTYLSTPLTVSFDSSGSYDPEGSDIVAHQWWISDGTIHGGVVLYEDNPTYTFSEAGLYQVVHWAYNEHGVAGYETFEVAVRPTEAGIWLSMAVWDDYTTGISTGQYTKQILIDDAVVWSADVVGDDDGWQNVLVDITEYVNPGEDATISLRLVSSTTSYFAVMCVDNVYIFGGDVGDSTMSSNLGIWSEIDPDGGLGYWNVDADGMLSGRLSTSGGIIGSWGTTGTGEIYQTVPILEPLTAMAIDDFESGDGTGGENWDANWMLTGSAAVTSSGTPYDGTYHLLLTGSSAVASRAVDLSDYGDDVTLSFEYKADSFESGEEVSVEIYDGSSWQEVMVIEDGDDDGTYHLASIDLSGYSLAEDFEIRFTASLADASDYFYVDDLMIA